MYKVFFEVLTVYFKFAQFFAPQVFSTENELLDRYFQEFS